MNTLTVGQRAVLILTAVPMCVVGAAGAVGTYANAASVLHRQETALGMVAAGEGATLVAALVMIVVTMLGQPSPFVARAALWLLPLVAAGLGLVVAPAVREAVVYGVTPLAMTASAEGFSFLARRIVVHRSGVDVEAQRRNASRMRRIAYHEARSRNHPKGRVRRLSELTVWRLMRRAGDGDTELGSDLVGVQREWLTKGARSALGSMLEPGVSRCEPPQLSPAHEPEPLEPVGEPLEPVGEPEASDLHGSREPAAHPLEPTTVPPAPDAGAQVALLVERLRRGEPLTKRSAAQILGVSPATAGRRLSVARARVESGTGFYP